MRLPLLAAFLALSASAVVRAEIDPANFDLSVRPEDDFYTFANGGWLKSHPIPNDHSAWGSFYEVQERNQANLHDLLDRAAANPSPTAIEKLVADFYASGMDQGAIDAAGIRPLAAELGRIAQIRSTDDVTTEVGHLHRLGLGPCFSLSSEQDPKNSEMMIAGCAQGGLGLPERDYYLNADEQSKVIRTKYAAHIAKMFELSGDSPSIAQVEALAVMKLETTLATGSRKLEELRDPIANYHKLELADLQDLTPHFDWSRYFSALGFQAPRVIDVGQPEFFRALDATLSNFTAADWRAYFRWTVIHESAPYLGRAFVDENFNFFGTTLSGTPAIRDRWKRVLSTIDGSIGEALGQLYVAQYFPAQAKARALLLVGNLRSALRERLQTLDWMDEPTRQAALRKIDTLTVKIGFPDKWIDYGKLKIDRGPYVLNVFRANEFNVRRDLDKIGRPVDRTEWGMSPPTVNAYYNPSMNEIVFPAGILQPPFFDAKADDAVNYGGIGAVIGHEMTHGFDDQGRLFDEKGNLRAWWTQESAARFTLRATAIIKQFNDYVAIDNLHVNGELTQGENIADLGGLKLSFAALKRVIATLRPDKIDGFTPAQRFFISYATVWRTNQRPEALRLQVKTNPHSPAIFRVDGPLSNLDEFAQAFEIPEGSPMRRTGTLRVAIW